MQEQNPTIQLKKVNFEKLCECGSKKPFGICCGFTLKQIAAQQFDKIKFPAPELMNFRLGDVICRNVWNAIHQRPKNEHLHEFIINVLLWTLGQKWHEEQIKKPTEEQHIIMRWLRARYDFLTNALSIGLPVNSYIVPTGEVREIVSLAADVYYLQLVHELPRYLVERLKSYDEFQGVRYELAVAASLVRAGFDITWKKSMKGQKCHEFDAMHKFTGEEISIEAKSRRRPGTLHQKGEMPDLNKVKADIFSLYNQAMEQNPMNKPFGIFIDINVPHQPNSHVTEKTWVADIMTKLEIKGDEIFGSIIPTFVAITNSAWHYEGKETAGLGEFIFLVPQRSPRPLTNPVTVEAVSRGLSLFSAIPQENLV